MTAATIRRHHVKRQTRITSKHCLLLLENINQIINTFALSPSVQASQRAAAEVMGVNFLISIFCLAVWLGAQRSGDSWHIRPMRVARMAPSAPAACFYPRSEVCHPHAQASPPLGDLQRASPAIASPRPSLTQGNSTKRKPGMRTSRPKLKFNLGDNLGANPVLVQSVRQKANQCAGPKL